MEYNSLFLGNQMIGALFLTFFQKNMKIRKYSKKIALKRTRGLLRNLVEYLIYMGRVTGVRGSTIVTITRITENQSGTSRCKQG